MTKIAENSEKSQNRVVEVQMHNLKENNERLKSGSRKAFRNVDMKHS